MTTAHPATRTALSRGTGRSAPRRSPTTTGRAANAGRPYTHDDDRRIAEMHSTGTSWAAIARELGRTEKAVSTHAHCMSVIPTTERTAAEPPPVRHTGGPSDYQLWHAAMLRCGLIHH